MDMDANDHGDLDDANGDGDGVWSEDIEQCFREALILFPPCGRRKHILPDGGGKMYGRNELIARYIEMRTGKHRTRKQVSSHIQVLARRKAKGDAASTGNSGISPSPSGIRSHSDSQTPDLAAIRDDQHQSHLHQADASSYYDNWLDRPIVTAKIRLVEFSAFIEYKNFKQTQASNIPQNQISSTIGANLSMSQPNQVGPENNSIISADLKSTQQQQGIQMIPDYQLQAAQTPNSGNTPATMPTQPLASNHHLPAQFNQSTSRDYHHSQHQHPQFVSNHNHQNHYHYQQVHPGGGSHLEIENNSAGLNRHYYVKIDYSRAMGLNQTSKLERININQVQDKFPEIGGPDGLYQRCPQDSFFLVKFWADLNSDFEHHIQDQNSFFGFSSHFETLERYPDITCSTKACSYGLQVVEKVEKIYGALNNTNGRYSFNIDRSPMCGFMIQFIKKLRQLPRITQMNSVLENFTVLQVITSESRSEVLFCIAYVFEVAPTDQNSLGPHNHVYRLTKD